MSNDQSLPASRPLEPQKRAIVVGASSGIGAALVRELVSNGYVVAAIARREAKLAELCEPLNAAHNKKVACPYVHNVTHFDDVPALFQTIVRDLGGLDLIIYNAGVMPTVSLDEYNFGKDAQMVNVNYLGAIAWLNEAAARFEQAGAGHIVGISSVAGDRGRIGAPVYNSSKAALNAYLEALRNRLTRHGLTVTTIKPGQVETRMMEGVEKRLWVISPEEAASGMMAAIIGRKQTVYLPARWRYFMLIIRLMPSFIFRRLSL